MTKGLDEILSGEEPERDTTTREPNDAPAGQPRGDHGHFASKEPKAPLPAAEPDPAPRPSSEPQPTADKPGSMVPQQALHAQRERAKTAEERASDLERQLAEVRGQVSVLTQQRQAPQPMPQAEPPKPIEFWDDPGKFVQQALDPIQQNVRRQQEAFSRRIAVRDHGADTVGTAFEAIKQAVASDPLAGLELQRMLASDHPYEEMVQWHKQHQAVSEIGDDPAAYRERLKAEILAEMQANPQGGDPANPEPPQPAPVMPSNLVGARNVGTRSGPAWQGPRPLNDIFDRGRKTG